jgi:hypothetical protein
MIEVRGHQAVGAFAYDAASRVLSIYLKDVRQTRHYQDVSAADARAFERAVDKDARHAGYIDGEFHHTTVDA